MDLAGLLDFVKQFGLPMALFIYLFYYTIKQSNSREERLMGALDKYATAFESLSQDVKEIKADVEDLKSAK